jgi:hypothetical protein
LLLLLPLLLLPCQHPTGQRLLGGGPLRPARQARQPLLARLPELLLVQKGGRQRCCRACVPAARDGLLQLLALGLVLSLPLRPIDDGGAAFNPALLLLDSTAVHLRRQASPVSRCELGRWLQQY